MNLTFEFRNQEQEQFYWSRKRNNRFGGGFGNGKTYVACQRAITMLLTFSNYRVAIARQVYKNLRATTMQTFFKILPKEFIFRHDEQFGITILTNGSVVYWLHLDQMDEATAKGFEINALIIDQAEEVEESIFLLMDSRVGRWDKAQVPQELLDLVQGNWPKHPDWGHYLVHNYVDILDNPADDEYHWVQRYFDDDSPERRPQTTHFSVVRQTDDRLNDKATIAQILTRDPAWIDKYYYGKKVISGARIHTVPDDCKIDPAKLTPEQFSDLLRIIKTKAGLYRVLDHGETSPTCVGWVACFNGIHLFFGEYYTPGVTISVHRQNIYDISVELAGVDNINNFTDFADPSIFKTEGQKRGGFWSVDKEYTDTDEISAPPIYFAPADNNELATRNRINELLRPSEKFFHPITKVTPAPGVYFLMSSPIYPHGVHNIVIETNKQKKELLGEINGKKFYSDERDKNVVDHGYDVLRYYVAIHGSGVPEVTRKAPRRSFAHFNKIYKMRQQMLIQG